MAVTGLPASCGRNTALEWSEPELWPIETGQTAVRGLDIQAMCTFYGAPGLAQALAALAVQARHSTAEGLVACSRPPLPGDFDVQARLEEQACALLGYEPAQIPALLQTPGYARALITGTHPGADSEVADRLVDECLARQVLVTRAAAPLPVTLILSEALMRCPVGEPLTLAG